MYNYYYNFLSGKKIQFEEVCPIWEEDMFERWTK